MGRRRPLNYRRRPSTAAFMLRALYPAFLRRRGPFPALRATWAPVSFDGQARAAFSRLTGLGSGTAQSLIAPQVFGFPLLLSLLTDPRFPVPIWGALQIRNHLLLRREYPYEAALRLEAGVVGQRELEKGVEVDLHLALRWGEELVWESLTTIYYRGRFGTPGPRASLAGAPDAGNKVLREWRIPAGGRWEFSTLTADHNGLHWSDSYARRWGHRAALLHPQRVLAECLARVPFDAPGLPQRLDAWIKGPVYYGEPVRLLGRQTPGGVVLALRDDRESRPAMVISWRTAASGERLAGEKASGAADGAHAAEVR